MKVRRSLTLTLALSWMKVRRSLLLTCLACLCLCAVHLPASCLSQFVRPLYRELFKMGSTCAAAEGVAVKTFGAFKHTYNPIAQKMIAKDLGLAPG
jgi:hypothetical protein